MRESPTATLCIVGASVRAAAQSARRAGYAVFAADMFADTDTQEAATQCVRVSDYPGGFATALRDAPPGPWMYTGGLENHPELVSAISAVRQLCGNDEAVLRRVRDPLAVDEALSRVGLPALEVCYSPKVPIKDHRWLVKPIKSCGGRNVGFGNPSLNTAHKRLTDDEEVYYQRYTEGPSASAVFVASPRDTRLIGVTRQLVGLPWAGARGFQYCGSVGPVALDGKLEHQITTIGRTLASEFRLRGLFGVDGIIADRQFWTVEVNPRYPASVEVLERAGGPSAIASHGAAFEGIPAPLRIPTTKTSESNVRSLCGKLIVYAQSDLTITPSFAQFVADRNIPAQRQTVADIPAEGTRIAQGAPIATVFAVGKSQDEVLAGLRERARELHQALGIKQ